MFDKGIGSLIQEVRDTLIGQRQETYLADKAAMMERHQAESTRLQASYETDITGIEDLFSMETKPQAKPAETPIAAAVTPVEPIKQALDAAFPVLTGVKVNATAN